MDLQNINYITRKKVLSLSFILTSSSSSSRIRSFFLVCVEPSKLLLLAWLVPSLILSLDPLLSVLYIHPGIYPSLKYILSFST